MVAAAVDHGGLEKQHDSHSGRRVTQADLYAGFYAHPFASYQVATTLTLVFQQLG
jgi:hypothetical protein